MLIRLVLRNRDEVAFRNLYEWHTPRLLRFVLRLTAGSEPSDAVESLYNCMTILANCAKGGWGWGAREGGIIGLAAVLVASAPASAQQLTPGQLESVRRGAASR